MLFKQKRSNTSKITLTLQFTWNTWTLSNLLIMSKNHYFHELKLITYVPIIQMIILIKVMNCSFTVHFSRGIETPPHITNLTAEEHFTQWLLWCTKLYSGCLKDITSKNPIPSPELGDWYTHTHTHTHTHIFLSKMACMTATNIVVIFVPGIL